MIGFGARYHCPAGDCTAIYGGGRSNHKFNIAPNLLNRDFVTEYPNQKWEGDTSYVWNREGWLYFAVILDLHSRLVLGWAMSNRMKRDLAIRALNTAISCSAELISRHPWGTRRKAEIAIFEHINGFYNPRRRDPALRWKSLSFLNARWPKRALEALRKATGPSVFSHEIHARLEGAGRGPKRLTFMIFDSQLA